MLSIINIKRYLNAFSLFALFVSVLALCSCVREPLSESDNKNEVKFRFNISTVADDIVNTRVGTEESINDLFVVVFDGNTNNANIIDWAQASSIGEKAYYASFKETTTSGYVYIFANIARNMEEGVDMADMHTLGDVLSKLAFSLRVVGGYIVEEPAYAPMISESIMDFSAPDALKNASTVSVNMIRTTAKVSVVNKSNNPRFALVGANMGNAPVNGHIYNDGTQTNDVLGNYAGRVSGETYSPSVMMKGVSSTDPNTTEPLYLFESSAKNQTFVVIRVTYDGVNGYHRLNIWKRATEEYIPIQRNHSYVVNINKVYTAGYASVQDAIDNPASNKDIDVDIIVKDAVSKDIVTNGTYYLGLSNTELIVYSQDELTAYTAVSIAHNAPVGVGKGTIEVNTIEGTGKLTYNDPFTASNDGNIHTSSVNITMPATVSKAEIILRIGNLAQKVRLVRKYDLVTLGGAVQVEGKFLSGEVDKASEWWMRLNDNDLEGFEDAKAEYAYSGSNNGELYMVMTNNILFDRDTNETRAAEMELMRYDDSGHTKVVVKQPPFDIFGKNEIIGNGQIVNKYVGAFWRHNQTAERLIRMGITGSSGLLSWDAQVAVGQTWVRLEKGSSSDANVGTDNPVLGDDPSFESIYQLKDKTKIAISGAGADVNFKIGLVGNKQYPTGYIGKTDHRYGLVLVHTYYDGSLVNTYRLFLRQGDSPDYLFRPSDIGYDNWGAANATPRPKAIKLSAYNLTDPALGIGTTMQDPSFKNYLKHSKMPLDYHPKSGNAIFNGDKFTKFPSQAGYFFVWNINTNDPIPGQDNREYMRAYHPTNVTSLENPLYFLGDSPSNISTIPYGEVPMIYDPKGDPCPYGYRYPSQGKAEYNKYTITTPEESELIQSILYDPVAPERGQSASSIMSQYTLWGYYADGFFDRMKMTTGSDGSTPSRVVYGGDVKKASGNDIGYAGQVIFNPYNYASIFFPATGRYLASNIQMGTGVYLWVSERESAFTTGANYPMDMESTSTYFFILKSQGGSGQVRPVRCVRDEKQWPNNGEQ